MRKLTGIALSLALTTGIVAPAVTHAEEGGSTYYITITNVTRGQVITPPVVLSHQDSFALFVPGQPARAELARLAEDGVTADLVSALQAEPAVHNVVAATAPIPPGGSATLEVKARGNARYLTAVGMLATTNDGFFAVHNVRLPRRGTLVLDAAAYDAGSEGNNESCAFIPGPPCGSPGVRSTADAEGFVHVHSGIHGIGDLLPAAHDWRNPVAEVTVLRVR